MKRKNSSVTRQFSVAILSAMLVVIVVGIFRLMQGPAGPEPKSGGGGTREATSVFNAVRVGDERQIRFRADAEELEQLGADAIDDQLRDWLLYAVLAESGVGATGFRDAMYDVPPTRAGYVSPIAAFDFGPTRFRVIDEEGTTLVLIPARHENRVDLVAQIADALRTRLGHPPKVLLVFEYELDPVTFSAKVTRKADIFGDSLFTADYGYVEVEVRTPDDLARFLSKTRDIVRAELISNGTRLGGRALKTDMRPMRVEDVAALWQSENSIGLPQKLIREFEAKWSADGIRAFLEQEFEREKAELLEKFPELNAPSPVAISPELFSSPELSGISDPALQKLLREYLNKATGSPVIDLRKRARRPYGQTPDENAPRPVQSNTRAEAAYLAFKARWDTEAYQKAILERAIKPEREELERRLQSPEMQRSPSHSGFSLDPAFNYGKLHALFLSHYATLAREVPAERLAEADKALKNRDEGPFLAILNELSKKGDEHKRFVTRVQQEFRHVSFQKARYDGLMQGTQVGMVLFYTDLLAKLWILDYEESAPDKPATQGYVPGFVPLPKVRWASIYEKERIELPGTRVWFGLRDTGFAKTTTALSFARVATRVYAASKNQLVPGDEAEANVPSGTFINWWNDHYTDIASYEPEYQRLNQIMKWSALLAWLHSQDKLGQFHFLSSDHVAVDRGAWFPTWAKANTQLKFNQWEKARFLPTRYDGSQTEALEILSSKPFRIGRDILQVSGGVSLADRSKLEKRPTLFADMPAVTRRPNIGQVESHTPEALAFRSIDDASTTRYTFKAGQRGNASVAAEGSRMFPDVASPGKMKTVAVKLRGTDAEMRAGTFDIEFTRTSNGVATRMAVNQKPIASLVTERRGKVVDVYFSGLATEHSRSLSRTLDRAIAAGGDPADALARRPDVSRAIAVDETTFYVESARREGWIKITPEGDPRADIASGVDLRTAGMSWDGDGPPPRWNVAFVDAKHVDAELSKLPQSVVEQTPSKETRGLAHSLWTRPPPPTVEHHPIDLRAKSSPLEALADGSGDGKGPPPTITRRFTFPEDNGRPPIPFLPKDKRRESLDLGEQLLKSGNLREARHELDTLAMAFPGDNEIQSRRVLAHAATNSRATSVEASELKLSSAELPGFLDLADVVAGHLLATDPGRRELDVVVRGTVAIAEGRRVAYARHPRTRELGIELRLEDASLTKTDGPARPGFAFYALELPATTAPTEVPLENARITEKLRTATGLKFHPEVLIDTAGNRYRRHSVSMTALDRAQPTFRARYGGQDQSTPPQPGPCDGLTDEQRLTHTDCNDEIYVIARIDQVARNDRAVRH